MLPHEAVSGFLPRPRKTHFPRLPCMGPVSVLSLLTPGNLVAVFPSGALEVGLA